MGLKLLIRKFKFSNQNKTNSKKKHFKRWDIEKMGYRKDGKNLFDVNFLGHWDHFIKSSWSKNETLMFCKFVKKF